MDSLSVAKIDTVNVRTYSWVYVDVVNIIGYYLFLLGLLNLLLKNRRGLTLCFVSTLFVLIIKCLLYWIVFGYLYVSLVSPYNCFVFFVFLCVLIFVKIKGQNIWALMHKEKIWHNQNVTYGIMALVLCFFIAHTITLVRHLS